MHILSVRLLKPQVVKPSDSVTLLRATDTYLELTLITTNTARKGLKHLPTLIKHMRILVGLSGIHNLNGHDNYVRNVTYKTTLYTIIMTMVFTGIKIRNSRTSIPP